MVIENKFSKNSINIMLTIDATLSIFKINGEIKRLSKLQFEGKSENYSS
jgi:hypothetical protein